MLLNFLQNSEDPAITSSNLYGPMAITWSVTGTYDVLTGVAIPNDPTFSFSGQASGSDQVYPVNTTTYTITASNQGAADTESLTIL